MKNLEVISLAGLPSGVLDLAAFSTSVRTQASYTASQFIWR